MLFAIATLFISIIAHAGPGFVIETGLHEPVVTLEARKDIEGLASAGSTYSDGKVSIATVGSASVVKLAKGYAVITAAHVVAGKKPWVEIGNKKIIPRGVWIDNDNDVALLDIGKGPYKAALTFGAGKLGVDNAFMQGIIDDKFPIVMIAYYHPGHALGFALRPWVDSGVESAYTRSVVRAPIISQSGDGRMIRVNSKITSGASGSAVLDLSTKSVMGLVVESHYYFSETYLASTQVLVEHFQNFIEGKRGFASKTQWLMKNRLTYRQFADGTLEANFATHPTSGVLGQPGNGILGQPGNGILGQPGNGILGQPGNGILGQPGNGILGQPGNGPKGNPGNGVIGQPGSDVGHPGNGVIGQPGNGILGQPSNGILGQPGNGVTGQSPQAKPFKPWSQDPRSVFKFFGVEPGIRWKNQAVTAFSVKNKGHDSTWPEHFNLLAEPEGIRYLEDHPDRFEFAPLKNDINYIDLLRERVGLKSVATLQPLTALYGPAAVVNSFEMWEPDHVSAEIKDDQVHVKIKVYSRMNRQTWNLEEDELEFTLGKNGAPLGEAYFLPVIEVKSLKAKETYYVDVRSFFFVDYSQLLAPIDGWSRENAPFEFTRFDFLRQIRTVGFSVRNANSGAEFSYGFGAADLAPKPETN